MNQIRKAQNAAARREQEQNLILQAGDIARSRFLASLYEQSMAGRYLSTKQMAVVERIIGERS